MWEGQELLPVNRPEFEEKVRDCIARMQTGLPFTILNPTIGGSPRPTRENEFGLPRKDISDAVDTHTWIQIQATRHVLRWYSARGIFPVNSTKHKCPKNP